MTGTRLRTARHALLALLGRAPGIRVLETAENRAQVRRLGQLRWRVLAALLLCGLLSTTLIYQITGMRGAAQALARNAAVPLATDETRGTTARDAR